MLAGGNIGGPGPLNAYEKLRKEIRVVEEKTIFHVLTSGGFFRKDLWTCNSGYVSIISTDAGYLNHQPTM